MDAALGALRTLQAQERQRLAAEVEAILEEKRRQREALDRYHQEQARAVGLVSFLQWCLLLCCLCQRRALDRYYQEQARTFSSLAFSLFSVPAAVLLCWLPARFNSCLRCLAVFARPT